MSVPERSPRLRLLRPAVAMNCAGAGARPAHTPGQRYCCSGCRWAARGGRRPREAGAGCDGRAGPAWAWRSFSPSTCSSSRMALWTADVYQPDRRRSCARSAVGRRLSLFEPAAHVAGRCGCSVRRWPNSAWDQLRREVAATDLLLLAGVTAATVYSAVSVFRGHGPVYFEVACVVLLAVTLGPLVRGDRQGPCPSRTRRDGKTYCRPRCSSCDPDGDRLVPAAEIQPATWSGSWPASGFRSMAGSIRARPPIDQQIVTGESQPVVREPGEPSSPARSISMATCCSAPPAAGVRPAPSADCSKPSARRDMAKGYYDRLAERAAAVFLPLVTVTALATLAWQWHSRRI